MTAERLPIHVIKVGGSLLDMPNLPSRLRAFRKAQPPAHELFVVGGGGAANAVRNFNQLFTLSEETGHWLAVRAMDLNAHCFLAAVLPAAVLAPDAPSCEAIWSRNHVAVMQPLAWLEDEERRGIPVPHIWDFTSDSIAAHVASVLGAYRLILLKSVDIPRHATPEQAAKHGWVDPCFPEASSDIPEVEFINLRTWSQPSPHVK